MSNARDHVMGAIADIDQDGRLDVFVQEGSNSSQIRSLVWYRMYALDNCPNTSNIDQTDVDQNLIGDACE